MFFELEFFFQILIQTRHWCLQKHELFPVIILFSCCITSILQNIRETELPYLVTLNPSCTPDHTLLKWSTGHPVPSVAASKASIELDLIQGRRGIWFCGAYQGESSITGKKMRIEHLLESLIISHIC